MSSKLTSLFTCSTTIPLSTKKKLPLAASLICTTALLSACGGGASNSVPEYVGEAADTATTETLQRNASAATSDSLGTTIDSMVQTMNGSAALGAALSIPGLGFTAAPNGDGVFNDPAEAGPMINPSFENRVRDETGSVFESTLGLTGQATSARDGNSVTVNPDETEICLEQDEIANRDTCEQLLVDLTVRIDADSTKSGTIHYLFRDQTVATIGYSPISGSYELQLAGVHSMLERLNELDSTSEQAPDTMTGSVRFDARVLNATAGSEAGTVSVSIPSTVTIFDAATEIDVSVAPSTLLQVTADAGSGSASVEVGIGALSFTSRNDELFGNPLQKLVMSGATARADLTRNGSVLQVSNVSLGNGPMVLSVDSLEVMRASMSTLGFTIAEDNNSIALNSELNYSLALRNFLGALDDTASHDSAADYSVSAAAGTTFSEMISGVMRVDRGGPLTLSYSISDGASSANGVVNVQQGECFGENYLSDAPIDLVGCN